MSTKTAPAANMANTSDREIVITRTFDAPRELVWDAWTDLKHVGKWWGPNGFTTTTHNMDFRVGGNWRYIMHGPDGRDYPNRVTYLEIARPERLVYNHGGGDKDLEDVEFHVTVTFEDQGGKTRVTMKSVFPSAAERDHVVKVYGAVQGGIQHLGRLAEHLASTGTKQRPVLTLALPSDREIVLSRIFEAPRKLVFEAFTKPEFLKQWWGLRGSTLAVCEVDLKPGGAWRFVLREPGGSEHPFKGVFREIAPPEKLVRTLIYDVPMARDHEAIETLVFTEEDGKTTVTTTTLHKTMEGRDGHLHSGMEPGAAETLDRLEELLRKLAQPPTGGNDMAPELEIISTRVFDAPRELVWEAFRDPERLKHWWGPNGFTNTIQEFDLKPGGKWRIIMHGPGGADYHNVSTFLEVVKPARVVYQHEEPIHRFQMALNFDDEGGKTKVTWRMLFESAEEFHKVQAFVADANEQNFDRLREQLEQMKKQEEFLAKK